MISIDEFTKAILEGQRKSKIKREKHKEFDIRSYEVKKALKFSIGRK